MGRNTTGIEITRLLIESAEFLEPGRGHGTIRYAGQSREHAPATESETRPRHHQYRISGSKVETTHRLRAGRGRSTISTISTIGYEVTSREHALTESRSRVRIGVRVIELSV